MADLSRAESQTSDMLHRGYNGPRRMFGAGSSISPADDATASLHLILRGRVRIERRHPQLSDSLVLLECGPGDVVRGVGRHGATGFTTVIALEETETVELEEGDAAVTEWGDSHAGRRPVQSPE